MTFISRIFHFRIIRDFLNSRVSFQLTEIATCIKEQVFRVLARTLNSRGTEFVNISENLALANISESTV